MHTLRLFVSSSAKTNYHHKGACYWNYRSTTCRLSETLTKQQRWFWWLSSSSTTSSSSSATTSGSSPSSSSGRNGDEDGDEEFPIGRVRLLDEDDHHDGDDKSTAIHQTSSSSSSSLILMIQHIRYLSPRKGFRCQGLDTSLPNHKTLNNNNNNNSSSSNNVPRVLPVRLEGTEWEWLDPPPPGWIFRKGIPYDLHDVTTRDQRQGRPYGYWPEAWHKLETQFRRHATHRQNVWPDDFYVNVEALAQAKAQAKERDRKKFSRRKS